MSVLQKTVVTMAAAGAAMLGGIAATQAADGSAIKNIVLVHGGFVDGSGWEGVYKILKKDGYTVAIVQNPTTSLADDVAVTKRAIAAAAGPVILVGHSYGGVVVTESGTDPKVAGVVYVTAFAPDTGESVSTLIANPPPGAPVPPILPPVDGFLFLDSMKFAASFAADVQPDLASFMAASQVPWAVAALEGKVTTPAWKSKPSWYLIATDDKMIPPDAQRMMAKRAGAAVVEAKGSHAIYVSQPQAVAKLIETAAMGAAKVKAKIAAAAVRFMGLLVGFMASGTHANARFDQLLPGQGAERELTEPDVPGLGIIREVLPTDAGHRAPVVGTRQGRSA